MTPATTPPPMTPPMTPRSTAGFTLVEVMVAVLVFAVAILTMVPLAAKLVSSSADTSHRTAATALASRQVEAIQKLDITTNSSALPLGLSTSTATVGGTVYSIQQNTTLSDKSSTTSICRSTGTTNLAYMLITVKVTWPNMANGTLPVRADTLKALGVGTDEAISGGVVAISVYGTDGSLTGIPVTLTGGGSTATQLSGGDGCVVFTGLTGSVYTATADSAGYVGLVNNQQTTITVTGVTSGSVSRATLTYANERTLPFDFSKAADAVLATGLAVHLGGSYVADAVPAGCGTTPTVLCADAVPGTIQNLYPDTYTIRAGNCVETGGSSSASVTLIARAAPATAVLLPLGSITVRVKTLVGGAPVPGRAVKLTHAIATGCSTGDTLTGVTDSTGIAKLAVPYGTWTPSTTVVGTVPVSVAGPAQAVTATASPVVDLVVVA